MKLFKIGAVFLTFSLLISCGSETEEVLSNDDKARQVDEGFFKQNTYRSELISWEMTYPKEYRLTKLKSLKATDGQAKNLQESDISNINYLLAFQYNFDNNFRVVTENFDGDSIAYKSVVKNNRTQIINSYLDNRQSIDTSSSRLKIAGQVLDVFYIGLYKKDKKFADQWMYTTCRKKQYITFILNANREVFATKVKEAFLKSKFPE
jgi:hypothetical protein